MFEGQWEAEENRQQKKHKPSILYIMEIAAQFLKILCLQFHF